MPISLLDYVIEPSRYGPDPDLFPLVPSDEQLANASIRLLQVWRDSARQCRDLHKREFEFWQKQKHPDAQALGEGAALDCFSYSALIEELETVIADRLEWQ